MKNKQPEQTSPNIIIAEDDKGLLRLIQGILQKIGFPSQGALSGARAISLIEKNSNAFLLLDYGLKDMTGKELIQTLIKKKQSVPFIIMTGMGDEKIAVKMMKLGARDYLVKENRFLDVLPSVVKRVLKELAIEKKLSAAEEALRESEKRFRDFFENAPVGYHIFKQPDFMIIDINQAELDMIGYTYKEIVGKKKWTDLIITEEIPRFKKHCQDIKEHKIVKNLDYTLVHKKGHHVFVLLSASGKYDNEGKLISSRVSVVNITERKQVEDALREKTAFLDSILGSSMNIAIAATDTDFRITYLNSAAEKKFGYTALDVIGKTVMEMHIKEKVEPSRFERAVEIVKKEGEFKYEIIQEKEDGKHYLESRISGIWDKHNRLLGFLSMSRDITEQKLSEYEISKLSFAVEQSPASIIMTDAKGNIEYVNPKFTEVTGYTKEEVIGKNPRFLKSDEKSQKEYKKLWDTITTGQIWQGEFHNKKKNGELFWESAFISPLKNREGVSTGFLAVKEDITSRKLAEQELIQAKELLEKRVEERTRGLSSVVKSLNMEVEMRREIQTELKKAMQSADNANRAKSDFLAQMSHDLRTPLNAILGYAQILKKGRFQAKLLPKAINTIHRSGEHLLNLINDILDLSKIESGKMELRPGKFSFADFLQNIADIMAIRAHQKNLDFQLKTRGAIPSLVYIDEKRLREILFNLIDNAIKYSPSGKVIFEVERKKTEQLNENSACIHFCIKDTGIGISKDNTEKIFKPFSRLEEMHSKIAGTGLGLSISKRLVALMGGDLQVKSIPKKGSSFYFELNIPVSHKDKQEMAKMLQSISGYKGAKRKIMIVDDNEENREVLASLLESKGFEINQASSGKDCLDKLDDFHPELIFMDLQMPKMSGFEVARKIRQQKKDIKIIASSATTGKTTIEKSKIAGCNDFLSKPIDIDKALELVASNLQLDWTHKIIKSGNIEKKQRLNTDLKLKLPQEYLERLINYADMGNPARILKELQRLEALDKRYSPIVKEFSELASDFKFDELIDKFKEK